MEKETLKRIFEFLEEKGEDNAPFLWKYNNDIPLTEGDLNVKGDLDLSHTEIETLPEGLQVGGHLDLIETDIKFLPKGLEVGRNLYIDDSPLIKYSDNQLREMIRPVFIKGEIFR